MIFEIHIPGTPLDRFVENFIYFEDFSVDHLIERFLPDGNVEVIIDLNSDPEHVYDNESLKEIQTCRNGWASGVRTKPISIPAGGGSTKLVVVFRKGMAYPFFPVPMSEISDTVVDADYLWGVEFFDLREQMLAAASPAGKFMLVEEFLLKMLGAETQLNPCVEFAMESLLSKPAETSLAELSTKIGYSHKHFIDMFRKQVGLTPKAYLRVMRFQKAVGEIEHTPEFEWASIALDSGFYDQAHFINDFKAFSGFTPNQYLQKKNGNLNYVPVR